MQTVDEALDAIRRMAGFDRLAFDGDGQVELVFDGETRVALVRVDEGSFELHTELRGLGRDLPRATLVRLLTANYLGEGTGAARLSLDPRDEVVSLGERIEVAGLDAAGLEARFARFLKYAAVWGSPEGRMLLGDTRDGTAEDAPGLMLRV